MTNHRYRPMLCPTCDNRVYPRKLTAAGDYYIKCPKCKIETETYATLGVAIREWNSYHFRSRHSTALVLPATIHSEVRNIRIPDELKKPINIEPGPDEITLEPMTAPFKSKYIECGKCHKHRVILITREIGLCRDCGARLIIDELDIHHWQKVKVIRNKFPEEA